MPKLSFLEFCTQTVGQCDVADFEVFSHVTHLVNEVPALGQIPKPT